LTTRLLDTNVCIEIIRGRADVTSRFIEVFGGESLRISTITVFELVYGAAKSGREPAEMAKVVRFVEGGPSPVGLDRADAEMAGRLRAELAMRGAMIGAYDLLIAGQARVRGWTLVTANTREFERVDGLTLEDWTSAPGPGRHPIY
jgi:tRNA(fMet)-specific endonuclease VapC